VKVNVPAARVVPLSTPAVLSDKPLGNTPAVTAKRTGGVALVAVMVWVTMELLRNVDGKAPKETAPLQITKV
jgi:hypothetical protein